MNLISPAAIVFQSVHGILVIIALVLFILAIIKPAWPLCAVGGLLLCVAMLAG